MKYGKLRGRIIEKYGTISSFSKVVGISRVSIYLKLSGKVGFTTAQVENWSRLLGIATKDIGLFFFC